MKVEEKKKVKDLKNAIIDNAQEIKDSYALLSKQVEIPYSQKSTDCYDMLRAFVKDFIVELQKKYKELGNKDSDNKTITALQMKFIWQGPKDSKEWDDSSISTTLGLTCERVRQMMHDITRRVAVTLMNEGKSFNGIVPSSQMKKVFGEFKSKLGQVELFPLLQKHYSVPTEDKKTLVFYLDGLNYDITKDSAEKPYCFNRDEFGNNFTCLKKPILDIEKLFKDEARPLRFEIEVRAFMQREQWSKTIQGRVEAFLKGNTSEYEWLGQDDFGNSLVALKWEVLNSIHNRIVRILFDYGETHPDNPNMVKDVLIEEYNRRAKLFGIKEIKASYIIQKSQHINNPSTDLYCYTGV